MLPHAARHDDVQETPTLVTNFSGDQPYFLAHHLFPFSLAVYSVLHVSQLFWRDELESGTHVVGFVIRVVSHVSESSHRIRRSKCISIASRFPN